MQPDGYFDERVAAEYDTYTDREEFAAEDVEATVDFLLGFAGEGPALEFGIGAFREAPQASYRPSIVRIRRMIATDDAYVESRP